MTGLTGADYTSGERQQSYVYGVNAAGQSVGESLRYPSGGDYKGQATWVAEASGASTRTGLYDDEHTGAGGFQMSYVSDGARKINASGQTIGVSVRYNLGVAELGSSAWIANAAGATTRLGLVDAEHTATNGTKTSTVAALNDAGQTIGESWRYNAGGDAGRSAWFGTAAGVTTKIGLLDGVYTSADGLRYSAVSGLTQSGYAWGWSQRYTAATDSYDRTAWIYDSNTGTTSSMLFGVDPTTGGAYSGLTTVLENGLGLGFYFSYDSFGTSQEHAFAWSMTTGMIDLTERLAGQATLAGLGLLNDVDLASLNTFLVGSSSTNQVLLASVNLSAAAVPEPGTWALVAGAAMLGLALMRRRRS